jgi:CheY-like chemotaxis protein
MDYEMPVLDGISATRRIREAAPSTDVVILSGSDVVAHSAGAHAAGALAYVRKANTSEDLPGVLAALLKRRQG